MLTATVNGFDKSATVQRSRRMVQTVTNKSRDLNCDEKIGSVFYQLFFFLQTFKSNKSVRMTNSRRKNIWVETDIKFRILQRADGCCGFANNFLDRGEPI